jgi:phage tail sheath protein FI
MPFQVSPGVNVSEIDLTTVIPAVSTTDGAIAGRFHWGPADKRVLIDSEDTLVAQFQKPDSDNYQEWFTAANFLAYGNSLYISRVLNGANNATASGNTSILVKNDDDYENNYSSGVAGAGDWVAKYPGDIANSLKVSVCHSSVAWESTLSSANLVFTPSSTSVLTKGANTSSDLTSGPDVDLSTTVSVGDILFLQSTGINLGDGIRVTAANSSVITLASAPTAEDLGTTGSTKVQSVAVQRRWEYYNLFDAAPGTSTYATRAGGSGDELHIAIVDEDGEITGVRGQVIQRFANLSRARDAKAEDGTGIYYKEVINQRSNWLWWASHVDNMTSAGGLATSTFTNSDDLPTTVSMSGGSNGSAPSNAQLIAGYDYFKSAEDVDVSLILGADADGTIATYIINNICETRKDCIVCLSPEAADVVNNSTYAGKEAEDIIAFRNTLPSSSYAVMDGAWKYQYDKYNDVYRYVPMNGDTAGLMVRTDTTRDPWFSPAGFNRGNVKNVVKLSFNPKKAERDVLYKAGVNPVVTFPGQGTVLFGDKTLLAKPSAFDRINVRRLFIVLEKAISTASKFTLFEFNDAFTRSQFRNLVEPFLRDVQGRRGIFDFRVVCDETNNTGEVIDRNEFIGDIYIKPARSINFIQLNFVAVRTGVDFEEVVGQF